MTGFLQAVKAWCGKEAPADGAGRTFVCGGRSVGYVIRPTRGRSIRIVVRGSQEVEVRVPPRVSAQAVRSFVEQEAEWIVRMIDRQAARPKLAPASYAAGATFYFLGRPLRLSVGHSVWKRVSPADSELRVTLSDPSDAEGVRRLVDAWFRTESESVLRRCLAEALERYGRYLGGTSCPLVLRPAADGAGIRLTVRAMRTRWGSCTRDGHVTLSVQLAHLPRRLIDYVIVHELCHLAHLNHSRAFYFQLARCLPDWAQSRRDLESGSWCKAQVPTC